MILEQAAPGQWWSHCPWRLSRKGQMEHRDVVGMVVIAWRLDLMILVAFPSLNDPVNFHQP